LLKLLIPITILIASNAFSQTVEKVKGNKALINMGEENYSLGTELVTVTVDGRKVGLVKVSQVKGSKAIVDVVKGTVAAGMTLAPRPAPKKRFAEEPTMEQVEEEKAPKSSNAYGALFGYSMDTLTTTTSFTGNSMKLKGFYDYVLNKTFTLRFAGGLDGFNAQGSGGNLAIQYLSLDGGAEWNFYQKKTSRAFADAGFSYQLPMSSSNNIGLSVSNNSVIYLGGGMNVPIGAKSFLPLYIHYNYIFPSAGVTLSSIELGIGYGWF